MRIALVSDIHGNIHGLDACLADLAAQGGADRVIGAGDYCMDGPQPRAVLQRLSDVGAACVRGNTDRYIAEGCDEEDALSLAWQRAALGSKWTSWLGALPFSLSIGEGDAALLVVHATPKSDDEHIWPNADDAFLERVTADVEQRTIAFGHLHLPYVRLWRDRLLINVASAGLPKDGDPRAAYALLTQRPGGWEVKHRRVAFDVDRVAREIVENDMPQSRRLERVLRRHRYKQLSETIP